MGLALNAGELDRRIRIYGVDALTQDATGEPIVADDAGIVVPAKLMEQRLSEVFSGASDQVNGRVVFRVRHRDDIEQNNTVVYPITNGQRYEITGIQEYGRRVGLDLICERLGENV